MNFSSIPGSALVKDKLIRSVVTGKVAHAQLFTGVDGALNLPLALAFATFLHCQSRGATDACGACPACTKSLKYIHPDTHFVFPQGNLKGDRDEDQFKADTLKTWRSFLLEHPFGSLADWISYHGGEDKMINISREEGRSIIRALALKPFESPHKIMLIWQPEFMHPTAANAILKILEEPPPNTFFLLVSNAAEQLLPTILSRTQHVHVPLLSDEELEAVLQQYVVDEERRKKIVQIAEGNLNAALALLEAEEDHHQENFVTWMRACFRKDYGALVGLSEEFHERDRLQQGSLLHYALGMMRETLINLSGAAQIARVRGGELEFISAFSKVMNVGKIEKSSRLINDAGYFIERNGSAKMIFLDLSLQLSQILQP